MDLSKKDEIPSDIIDTKIEVPKSILANVGDMKTVQGLNVEMFDSVAKFGLDGIVDDEKAKEQTILFEPKSGGEPESTVVIQDPTIIDQEGTIIQEPEFKKPEHGFKKPKQFPSQKHKRPARHEQLTPIHHEQLTPIHHEPQQSTHRDKNLMFTKKIDKSESESSISFETAESDGIIESTYSEVEQSSQESDVQSKRYKSKRKQHLKFKDRQSSQSSVSVNSDDMEFLKRRKMERQKRKDEVERSQLDERRKLKRDRIALETKLDFYAEYGFKVDAYTPEDTIEEMEDQVFKVELKMDIHSNIENKKNVIIISVCLFDMIVVFLAYKKQLSFFKRFVGWARVYKNRVSSLGPMFVRSVLRKNEIVEASMTFNIILSVLVSLLAYGFTHNIEEVSSKFLQSEGFATMDVANSMGANLSSRPEPKQSALDTATNLEQMREQLMRGLDEQKREAVGDVDEQQERELIDSVIS